MNRQIRRLCALLFSLLLGTMGVAAQEYDVYAFGSQGSGSYMELGYWKNGEWTKDAPSAGRIQRVAVSGSDIYCLRSAGNNKLIIWKNGQALPFEYSGMVEIAVDGDDVYAVPRDMLVSSYWKNGEEVALPSYPYSNNHNGQVETRWITEHKLYHIAARNGVVGIAGQSAFWRNDRPHGQFSRSISHSNYGPTTYDYSGHDMYTDYRELWINREGDPYYPTYWYTWAGFYWTFQLLEKIAVEGNSVYLLPYVYHASGGDYNYHTYSYTARAYDSTAGEFHLAYWLDDDDSGGHPVILESGLLGRRGEGRHGVLEDVAVLNGDVYVSGRLYDTRVSPTLYQAVYWKNGQKTVLGESTRLAWPSAMQVVGDDVYILGVLDDYDVIWKNGELLFSVDRRDNYKAISFLAVVPHSPTGLAKPDLALRFAPNPVRDELRVDLPSLEKPLITDLAGRLQPCPSQFAAGQLSIDVSRLSPGIYFIRIGNRQAKFIKQ